MESLRTYQKDEDTWEAVYGSWQGYGASETEAVEDLAASMQAEAEELKAEAEHIINSANTLVADRGVLSPIAVIV